MTNLIADENTSSAGLDNLSYLLLQNNAQGSGNGNASLGLGLGLGLTTTTTAGAHQAELKPYEDFYLRARFITGLVCYPVVCLFGLTGNVISILVLSRRNMYSSTSVYLIALGVSDSIKVRKYIIYYVHC